VCVEQNKNVVKKLAVVPSLNIEREVDGSVGGNKDDRNVCEEAPSISVPGAKRKKCIKKNEARVGDDKSKEETPISPCVPKHTEKEAVKNLDVVQSLHIECEVDGSVEETRMIVMCVKKYLQYLWQVQKEEEWSNFGRW